MFFGLAFLSSHEVSDAFVELTSVCSDEIVCTEFSDYIFNNYIDTDLNFPQIYGLRNQRLIRGIYTESMNYFIIDIHF